MDDVAKTGRPIVVTKRGKPVVRIVPIEEPPSLVGSVTYLVDDEELLFSTGETWSVDESR